jgi:hypothetical protein
MGLTNRELHDKVVRQECPHYYELTLPNGSKRHCGTLKDVECLLSIYPDAIYSKVLLPPVPDTINVPYITVKDQELPMQQILLPSDLEPLNL